MKLQATTTFGGRKANEAKGLGSRDGYRIKVVFETDDPAIINAAGNEGMASFNYRGGHLLDVLGLDKNTDVEFSEADRQVVEKEMTAWYAAGCPNKKGTNFKLPKGIDATITVGRYTPGDDDSSPMLRASRFIAAMLATEATATSCRTMLKALGLETADTAGFDTLVEFAHSKGLGASK
jgi:hypothetical protein